MILEYKTIDLFGNKLFSWASLQTPVRFSGQMDDQEACFSYVLEGESHTFSEKENIVTQAHEAFLSKCGNYVTKLISGNKKGSYSTITVHFHEVVLKKVYADDLPWFLKKGAENNAPTIVKIHASQLVKQYIDSIRSYFASPEPIREELLVLKLKEIILLLLETENAPFIRQLMSSLFCRKTYSFKEVVEAHICSSISLAELASLTNHSHSSFKREFKRIYSDTPGNYIIQRRVEKVAELLLLSDESISHIAYDCGFKNLAHLSKVFKSRFGQSPSEYRLQLVKN